MICTITQIALPPPHLHGEKLLRAQESMGMWEVRYGSSAARSDHIAGYFGLVPMSLGRAWVWAEVMQRYPNRGMIRLFLRAWSAFIREREWELFAVCAPGRDKRFAEYLGFEHYGFQEGQLLMRRI